MDTHTFPIGNRSYGSAGEFASGNALPRGARLREFEVVELLGEGGFSIVYSARDLKLQRDVAIKEYIPVSLAGRTASSTVCLRSENLREAFEAGLVGFINEARLLAQFKHPALVEVLQFWEENDTAYMVMPHYRGQTLRAALKAAGSQRSEAWLRGIIAPVLDVLELLHARNVYHRDVAPDNVLIRSDGSPVLLDLGSAREVLAGLQKSITVVVKPGYAPIEQYSNDFSLPQGPWTDVYAVGALLYFAITGNAPPASVTRIMKDGLQPLAALPTNGYSLEFRSAIDTALSLHPSARPQSIPALRTALGITATNSPTIVLHLGEVCESPAVVSSAEDDDAHTVIVSADEIAELVRDLIQQASGIGGVTLGTGASAWAARTGFENPMAASGSSSAQRVSNDFPDVAAMLTAHVGADTRSISVPGVHDLRGAMKSTATSEASVRPAWRWPAAAASVIGAIIALVVLTVYPDSKGKLEDRLPDRTLDVVVSDATPNTPATSPKTSAPESEPPQAAQSPTADKAAESPSLESAATRAVEDVGIRLPSVSEQAAPPILTSDTHSERRELPTTHDEAEVEAPLGGAAVTPIALPPSTLQRSASANSTSQNTEVLARWRAGVHWDGGSDRVARPSGGMANTTGAVVSSGIRFTVQPWAEIWIDGRQRGISPPVRFLPLSPGSYNLELRNPVGTPVVRRITIRADEPVAVDHRFVAAAGESP